MIIKIEFKHREREGLLLPLQYNEIVQGFIYRHLDEAFGEFLHNRGYQFEKRQFRLFAFSKIIGKFNLDLEKKAIHFWGPAHFYITTVINELSEDIINKVLLEEDLYLYNQPIVVTAIEAQDNPEDLDTCICRTLSPITVYSTIVKPDGKSFVHYYAPGDPDYNTLITNNLKKKYMAYYGEACEGDVKIRPLGRMKMRRIYYKNIATDGFDGRLELSGDPKLVKLALETGLGSRNSQGFGCIITTERRDNYD